MTCGSEAQGQGCKRGLLLRRLVLAALVAASTATAQDLPREGWTATADSFQPGNEPSNVLDSTYKTFWHTEYNPDTPGYPHQITLTFNGQTNSVTGLSYRPRGDGSNHGRVLLLYTSHRNFSWVDIAAHCHA